MPHAAVRALLRATHPAAGTDAELLARFAAGRDEAAFAELVRRHAGLVRGVARRVTGNPDAADDATQAVFLLLARKAAAGGWGPTVGPWLYRVACRVAAKARARAARRTAVPFPPDIPAPPSDPAADLAWADVRGALDAALAALPARLRDPLVLCYLEGLTRDEAAAALGCSSTALKGRVARGRDRLRRALAARGLSLSAGLAGALVGEGVSAGAAAALARSAAAYRATGTAPPAVRALLREAAGGWAPAAALAGFLVACGVAVLAAAGPAQNPPGTPPPADKAADPLPAGAAVRLGSTDLRHPAHLTDLRFTPDGRAVVSYGSGVTRHWDARTGRQLPAQTADITPTTAWNYATADGSAVVAVHLESTPPYRNTVRRYDAATGRHEELFALPAWKETVPRTAPSFAFAPDGGLLAARDAGATTVWDLKTRRPRFTIESPDGHLLFTPDGKHLLTAGGDSRTVRFWDTQTGKQTRSLGRDGGRLPQSGLVRLVISPDGRWVAGVDNGHLIDHGTEVTIWDLNRPDRPRVLTVLEGFGHSGAPAFGPDGTVYTVTDPFKRWLSAVSRWDTATGERVAKWDGPKPDWRGGLTAAVSPDGSALAVGTYAGAISLYDARTGKVLAGGGSHAARVVGVAFDPAEQAVRTAAEDGSAATWDARTGEAKARRGPPDVDRTGGSTGAVLSPDGRWLLTHEIRHRPDRVFDATVWDAATGAKRFTREIAVQVRELLPVPGGDLLVCRFDVTGGEAVEVWNAATGAVLPPIQRTFERGRARFAVTPAGPTLVACDQESVVGYDPRTGKEQFAWKLADRNVIGNLPRGKYDPWPVSAVAASPDGKTLAVAVAGPAYIDVSKRTHSLVLVETRTGQVIRRAATPETLAAWLVFSPDGRRLAGPRCVWDVATLAEVRRLPARPEVTAAAFSPDGARVATGHANGTALVWPLGRE